MRAIQTLADYGRREGSEGEYICVVCVIKWYQEKQGPRCL